MGGIGSKPKVQWRKNRKNGKCAIKRGKKAERKRKKQPARLVAKVKGWEKKRKGK